MKLAIARRVLRALLGVLVVVVVLTAALIHLTPFTGHQLFAIRSGSMEPALATGAAAIVSTGNRDAVDVGSIVTYRLPNGAAVTHRVVEVVDDGEGRFLRTKGDANEHADAALVPADWVIGEVSFAIPWLGFLVALLGMPIGIVTVLSIAASLITAIWILDELERTTRLTPAGDRT